MITMFSFSKFIFLLMSKVKMPFFHLDSCTQSRPAAYQPSAGTFQPPLQIKTISGCRVAGVESVLSGTHLPSTRALAVQFLASSSWPLALKSSSIKSCTVHSDDWIGTSSKRSSALTRTRLSGVMPDTRRTFTAVGCSDLLAAGALLLFFLLAFWLLDSLLERFFSSFWLPLARLPALALLLELPDVPLLLFFLCFFFLSFSFLLFLALLSESEFSSSSPVAAGVLPKRAAASFLPYTHRLRSSHPPWRPGCGTSSACSWGRRARRAPSCGPMRPRGASRSTRPGASCKPAGAAGSCPKR